MFLYKKEELDLFASNKRLWQGVPSIEITKNGTIYAAFFTGGIGEEIGNYCVIVKSIDDGSTFEDPVCVICPELDERVYNPCLWIDPLDRLWVFFTKGPNDCVYGACCINPDNNLLFEEPIFIANGKLLNKPIVLDSGEWVLPVSMFPNINNSKGNFVIRDEEKAFAYTSKDNGKTFVKMGGINMPRRCFDEHVFLQKNNGDVEVYVRTYDGVGVGVSKDHLQTFEVISPKIFDGPNSRFCIKRLSSGNILFINHYNFKNRDNLTAFLSIDDGKTFPYKLLLDKRNEVSYPDCKEFNGYIYIIYDHERGVFLKSIGENKRMAKEILLTKISEKDIIKGKIANNEERKFQLIVSKITNYDGLNLYESNSILSEEAFANEVIKLKDNQMILDKIFDYCHCGSNIIMFKNNQELKTLCTTLLTKELSQVEKKKLVLNIIKILNEMYNERLTNNILVDNIRNYIVENLDDDLSLEKISMRFNVSIYYMLHVFKEYTSVSIIKFILYKKIERACLLFEEKPNLNITDVAFMCGFNSTAYFDLIFRRTMGVTPKQYIKKLRNNN